MDSNIHVIKFFSHVLLRSVKFGIWELPNLFLGGLMNLVVETCPWDWRRPGNHLDCRGFIRWRITWVRVDILEHVINKN